jgi:hypothetical protein
VIVIGTISLSALIGSVKRAGNPGRTPVTDA